MERLLDGAHRAETLLDLSSGIEVDHWTSCFAVPRVGPHRSRRAFPMSLVDSILKGPFLTPGISGAGVRSSDSAMGTELRPPESSTPLSDQSRTVGQHRLCTLGDGGDSNRSMTVDNASAPTPLISRLGREERTSRGAYSSDSLLAGESRKDLHGDLFCASHRKTHPHRNRPSGSESDPQNRKSDWASMGPITMHARARLGARLRA